MKRAVRRFLAFMAATTIVPVVVVGQTAVPADAASALVTCEQQSTGGGATTAPLVSYTSILPIRLIDTRNNIGGVGAPIGAGCTMRVKLGAEVPAIAQAVALSMTAVGGDADFFTVYSCSSGRPETSNLNSREGFATPNLVVAIPDSSREICIFSHGRSHLIIDLSGWWSDGPNRFTSVTPQRVYDSRRPGFTALSANRVREVQLPVEIVAADATAAVVNLTAVNGLQPGFITAFPCGQAPPVASNVNFLAGEARASAAIVGLGPVRKLCLLADTSVHIIVDVTGYYSPAPAFGPSAMLEPSAGRRVVDTRNGIGGPKAPPAAGEVRAFDPVAGLPDANDASAVVVNFVSTGSVADGFITVYPCGGAVPEVSTLNFRGGENATNLAIIELGADRLTCVVSSAQTELIVDVFGVMTAPTGSPIERLAFDKPTWPPFNQEATDYVIECGAGSGVADTTMRLELLPFTAATLSVAGGSPTSVASGTTTVSLGTDQPLVVSTNRQGVDKTYHFRCVPLDFPRLDVLRPGNPTNGWYLTTFGFVSPSGAYVVILDSYGAPVWYKHLAQPVIDLKRLSDGRLTFIPSYGPYGVDPAQGYWVTDLQATSTELRRTVGWDAPVDPLLTDHHDYVEIPGVVDGRALVSYPIRPFGAGDTFADGVIQESDGAGNVLWTWSASDQFDPTESTFPLRFGTVPGFTSALDAFHINSIDRQPDGDYVVGARHLDAAFRVNRDPGQPDDGEIEWIVGGPPGRPEKLTIIGDPYNGPKRPHDARMVGNVLTMFDNQAGMPGRQSRVVAYSIDTTAGTATMLWEFRNGANYTGDTLGSVRKAADGSILIGWSAGLQPIIEEIAPNGSRLLAIGLALGGNSYRTVKYPPGDFDVDQLRSSAGGSVTPP
jgi:hypothetical protein